MNLRSLIAVFFVFCCSYAFSQVNSKYIKHEKRNQRKWLSKAVFEPGYIIYNNKDTVDVNLLVFRKGDKINSFIFCVAKNTGDSIQIIPAEKILEYRIGKTVYKKVKEKDEHFFIKQLIEGEVSLFEREAIPSDHRFLYYLQRKNQQGYYEICPDEANFQIVDRSNSYSNQSSNRQDVLFVSTGNTAERFKKFVSVYFPGCERLQNMVKAEIYTVGDIRDIVEAYNKCR